MAEFRRNLAWLKNSDILVALAVITVIMMLIIPLPTSFLDVGLSLNIALSLVIMLTVLYVGKATDFSVFPTLILFATLFRIALNVSSTRLILSEGKDFDGQVITAFGDFVVGGNYIIGLVIFLILTLVQVMVITKGATRVSEVAARFTLDALPGKQMEVTNELASNLISEQEARDKKKAIQKEADFYGAMDGASKFVQGDVRLGIIIIFINIIGGLVVGLQQGLGIADSAKVFLSFTIGDGLVSQIPSLLMSIATGVIVTRSMSDSSFGTDLSREIVYSSKPFFITATFLLILGFLPGFPLMTLSILAMLFILAGYYIEVNGPLIKAQQAAASVEGQGKENQEAEDDIFSLINIEPMELEIGFGLIPLVDPKQGGDLLERIKLIRKTMALELGLVVPPIRIRDNMHLNQYNYIIKIKGLDVGSGILRIDHFLAIPPQNETLDIPGIDGIDPIFKTPGKWIKEEYRMEAEKQGCSVVDCPTVIATHLTEILRTQGFELMGRQETKKVLDSVREQNNVLITEVEKVGIGEIQKIFQNLLRDGISIRNITTILEIIADSSAVGIKNSDTVTERVRSKLGKQIIQQYIQSYHLDVLSVISLDSEWENIFDNSLQELAGQTFANIPSEYRTHFIHQMNNTMNQINLQQHPVLVTSDRIRSTIRNLLRTLYPKLQVFSYTEISEGDVKINHIGSVEWTTQEDTTASEENIS